MLLVGHKAQILNKVALLQDATFQLLLKDTGFKYREKIRCVTTFPIERKTNIFIHEIR